MTISSLNFGRPAPPGRGLRQGEIFWLHLTTASAQCLRLSEPFLDFFLKPLGNIPTDGYKIIIIITRMAFSRAHTSGEAADVTKLLLLKKCRVTQPVVECSGAHA